MLLIIESYSKYSIGRSERESTLCASKILQHRLTITDGGKNFIIISW
jgi:hypothetical protein